MALSEVGVRRVALRTPGGFETLRAGGHRRFPRMTALRDAALPLRLVVRSSHHIGGLLVVVVAPLESKFFPELPVLFAPREEVVGRGGMLYRASGDLAFRATSRMDVFTCSATAHLGSPFGTAKDAPPQRLVVRPIRNLPNLPLLVLVAASSRARRSRRTTRRAAYLCYYPASSSA